MKHCIQKATFAVPKIIENFKITTMQYLVERNEALEMSVLRGESVNETGRHDVIDIILKRFCYHPQGTLGVIDFAGERFYTIERPWRENKPYVSCIPTGSYMMRRRESPRFGETWHVLDVEDRTHILIHVANFPNDVQGCIGLGKKLMNDRIAVASSKAAMKDFEALTRDLDWRLVISNVQYAALNRV